MSSVFKAKIEKKTTRLLQQHVLKKLTENVFIVSVIV